VLLTVKFVLVVLLVALDNFGIDLENLCQGLASFYCPMLVAPLDKVYRCLCFVSSGFGFVVKIVVGKGSG
jgi:hypothetical protein